MYLIVHKNNLYNSKSFLQKLEEDNHGNYGVMLDVVATKDKQLLIFSPVSHNKTTIDTIQNNTLEELSYLDILTLEETLTLLDDFKGKVILNLLPLNEPSVIEEYLKILQQNELYIKQVNDVIERHPQLQFYLCSTSHNLLFRMVRTIKIGKLGVVLSTDNSNYLDVNFYVFPPEMLQNDLLLEQLQRGKEIMIQMQDCDEMERVLDFLQKEVTEKEKVLDFQYITNHPKIFHLAFSNQERK